MGPNRKDGTREGCPIRSAAALIVVLAASACGTSAPLAERAVSRDALRAPRPPAAETGAVSGAPRDLGDVPAAPATTRVPNVASPGTPGTEEAGSAPRFGSSTVDVSVPPLLLPTFIELAFGELLQVPYTTGPGIADRTDIVQLRSSGPLDSATFFELTKAALTNYGVRVIEQDGAYQVIEDAALKARLPRFVRSRARSETPGDLRPVVQFVELQAVSAQDMSGILQQAFGRRGENLRIEVEPRANFLVLSGLPEDVDAALAIIEQMDELQYAGTTVRRYSPQYTDVRTLGREVSRILEAEGWQTSTDANSPKAVLLLAVDFSNDLLVFTRSPEARGRADYWIAQLDRPARRGEGRQYFVYRARNLDAALLASTVNSVLGEGGIADQSGLERIVSRAAGEPVQAVGNRSSRFTVDPLGNRLVFSGTASEYDLVKPLLLELDQRPAEVLIEVVIAQVNLSDTTRFGVEFVVDSLDTVTRASTLVRAGSSGVTATISGGDVSAVINAFASNSQIEVLSRPRLVARSGTSAQVQVGSEVPVLASQQLLPTGSLPPDGNLGVISQVVYRSTGIILQIEPIVFGDSRVDLTLSQEVSSTAAGTGPVASPTFNNTTVTTSLSLEDGATAVIGGLIQDQVNQSEQGIPFLKDIPLVGGAFSSREYGIDRTELVFLITPYVLRSAADKETFVERFTADINETLARDNLLTLRPR